MTAKDSLPDFYNDLDKSMQKAWDLLKKAARQRKSPMHTPVLAGMDRFGKPTQRVMVLREVNDRRRGLRFHTDLRSPKVAEFGVEYASASPASILAYHPDERVQLRLNGKAWVESDSDTADVAWHMSDNYARRCYLAEDGPGALADMPTSGLPEHFEGIKPSDEEILPARKNFAVLLAEIDRIEWLYLASAGHRKARWTWNAQEKAWDGAWLIP